MSNTSSLGSLGIAAFAIAVAATTALVPTSASAMAFGGHGFGGHGFGGFGRSAGRSMPAMSHTMPSMGRTSGFAHGMSGSNLRQTSFGHGMSDSNLHQASSAHNSGAHATGPTHEATQAKSGGTSSVASKADAQKPAEPKLARNDVATRDGKTRNVGGTSYNPDTGKTTTRIWRPERDAGGGMRERAHWDLIVEDGDTTGSYDFGGLVPLPVPVPVAAPVPAPAPAPAPAPVPAGPAIGGTSYNPTTDTTTTIIWIPPRPVGGGMWEKGHFEKIVDQGDTTGNYKGLF